MDEYGVIAFAAHVRKANFCSSPAAALFTLMNRAWELDFSLGKPYWKELLVRIGVNPEDVLQSSKTFKANNRLPAIETYREFIGWLRAQPHPN
ncbi:hypothetical protein KJ678_03035 [Patescibacteria group bacterium]|nr:hypothetical protein [Patescibacteria group bacterium]